MSMGARLKQKRQEKGLSANDVALQLRISAKAIEAIEADEKGFPGTPATIYQGFIRSYAKLLKVEMVSPSVSSTPIDSSTQSVARAAPVTSNSSRSSSPSASSSSSPSASSSSSGASASELKDSLVTPSALEAETTSWTGWLLAIVVLVVGSLSIKMFQKYRSEVYRAAQTPHAESPTVPATEGVSPESVQVATDLVNPETESSASTGLALEPASSLAETNRLEAAQGGPAKDSASVALAPSALPEGASVGYAPSAASVVTVPSAARDITGKGESATALSVEAMTPMQYKLKSMLPQNEIMLDVKKGVALNLKSDSRQIQNRLLESGRIYLIKEKGNFKFSVTEAKNVQVIFNGRIVHSPGDKSAPVQFEVRE